MKLRERLRDEMSARRKSSRECIAALTIKTWNAWLSGETIHLLKYNEFGPQAESFPETVLTSMATA